MLLVEVSINLVILIKDRVDGKDVIEEIVLDKV